MMLSIEIASYYPTSPKEKHLPWQVLLFLCSFIWIFVLADVNRKRRKKHFLIVKGGHAGFLFDKKAEVIDVVKSASFRDLFDRVIAGSEQLTGKIKAKPVDIPEGGDAKFSHKKPPEVRVAHPAKLCQLVYGDMAVCKAFVDRCNGGRKLKIHDGAFFLCVLSLDFKQDVVKYRFSFVLIAEQLF
jgi:hypothetical protein